MALYVDTDDNDLIVNITIELERRDFVNRKKAKQTARDKARWQAVYDEWVVAAHAQYLQAEAICCGNLIDKRVTDGPSDPFSLWIGPESWAFGICSEEMRDFWAANPRQTVSQFRAGLRAAKRDARRTALDTDLAA